MLYLTSQATDQLVYFDIYTTGAYYQANLESYYDVDTSVATLSLTPSSVTFTVQAP